MSNLSIFQFDSVEIRFVEIEGITYAVGVDVARALGYADPNTTILRKVNKEYTCIASLSMEGQNRDVTCISEAGIYQLIFGSKLESAERFRRWVFEQVLPSIRQHGFYQTQQAAENLENQFGDRPELRDVDLAAAMFGRRFGLAYEQRYLMQQVKKHHPQLAGAEPQPEERASVSEGEALLTPTDIARELGLFYKTGNPNAQSVNKLLEKLGYQVRVGKQWSATDKATNLGLCDRKPVETNSRSQKDQMLWSSKIIPILKEYILK
jgi:prophage antirepressor-like protein